MMAILHIASLAAHTTSKRYTFMEISIKRSHQHWCPSEGSNSEHFFSREWCLNRSPTAPLIILTAPCSKYQLPSKWHIFSVIFLVFSLFFFCLASPYVGHPINRWKLPFYLMLFPFYKHPMEDIGLNNTI